MITTPSHILIRSLAAAAALTALTACGGSSGSTGTQGATPSSSASVLSTGSPSATASPAARPPGMVAVTSGGALVVLNSATGAPARTLVPGGVLGDEISVSPDGGTVYFAEKHGCTGDIAAVPVTGGSPVVIAAGTLPALSPDGKTLAFAREPSLTTGCVPASGNLTTQFQLVLRTLSSGAERVLPMLPASQSSGLPAPISHVSWAADDSRLLVSVSSVQDNEGWQMVIVNTGSASFYLSGAGDVSVPVSGAAAQRSYWREGVFMPNGNLFVSRVCCAGFPVHNRSALLWEVSPGGVLQHQVAVGFPNLVHTSLAVNRAGRWLLYLAGTSLYVSDNGSTPRQLGAGLAAAAWL